LILNVFVSTVFLAHIEGSRRGAAWSWLARTPLAGFVCTAVGGIGVYVPLMLVPLLNHHRANAVALPRVYALLVALGINVAVQILAFVHPQDASFLGRAVAGQVLYGHLAWFLYTPLTVVFEKVVLAVVLIDETSTEQVVQVFGYQFRAERAEASSAYYLLWDTIGAAWGALLWIVMDSGT
ncbi:hypothetical protein BGZ81_002441, partial [Podila clonocystis]